MGTIKKLLEDRLEKDWTDLAKIVISVQMQALFQFLSKKTTISKMKHPQRKMKTSVMMNSVLITWNQLNNKPNQMGSNQKIISEFADFKTKLGVVLVRVKWWVWCNKLIT
jgi:hypothetical protein